MTKNNLLGPDIDFERLASLTKNYTGSEIEAVCTSVKNFVLKEDADAQLLGDQTQGGGPASVASGIQVDKNKKKKSTFQPRQAFMTHFSKALEEVRPAFGMDDANLENKLKQGFFNYGEKFQKNYMKC